MGNITSSEAVCVKNLYHSSQHCKEIFYVQITKQCSKSNMLRGIQIVVGFEPKSIFY